MNWSAEGGARSSLLYGGEGVSHSPTRNMVIAKRLRLHIAGSTLPHPRPTSIWRRRRFSFTHQKHGDCGRHGTEEWRVTSGGLAGSPVAPEESDPISGSEVGSGALPVVGLLR